MDDLRPRRKLTGLLPQTETVHRFAICYFTNATVEITFMDAVFLYQLLCKWKYVKTKTATVVRFGVSYEDLLWSSPMVTREDFKSSLIYNVKF